MDFVWAYLVVGMLFVLRSSPAIISDLRPRPATLLRRNKPPKRVERYYGVLEAVVHIFVLLLFWPLFALWIIMTLSAKGQEWLGERELLP